MDENCPFCKIIKGDIPSQKVYEDDQVFAVLDINPARPGHILVLPKEHQFILPLLSPEQYSALLAAAKKIAPSLHKSMIVDRVTLFAANGPAAGQQSPHAFIHLIAREESDGLEHLDLSSGSIEQSARDAISHNTKQILQRLPPIQGAPPLSSEKAPAQPLVVNQEQPANNPNPQDRMDMIFELLQKEPQLHQLLIADPEQVVAFARENPGIQSLFEGVDIKALSALLREQQKKEEAAKQQDMPTDLEQPVVQQSQEEVQPTPQQVQKPVAPIQQTQEQPENPTTPAQEPVEEARKPAGDVPQATTLTDKELLLFLEQKPQLKELLLDDPAGLAKLIPQNDRLASFFSGTNTQAVAVRVKKLLEEDERVDFDLLKKHL